ncbi:MAG: hypothetical protein ACFFBZ_14475 [Promethearchaeota archaeon]
MKTARISCRYFWIRHPISKTEYPYISIRHPIWPSLEMPIAKNQPSLRPVSFCLSHPWMISGWGSRVNGAI